jgi:hypothetical protein
MANPDSVGQNTQDSFGNYRIATGVAPANAVANAVVALPILSGGMQGSGNLVLRRITVALASNTAGGSVANLANTYISIGTTNDGANLVTSNVALANITGGSTYQDITLVAAAASSTYQPNALFVNITANAVANHQVRVFVYGDVLSF